MRPKATFQKTTNRKARTTCHAMKGYIKLNQQATAEQLYISFTANIQCTNWNNQTQSSILKRTEAYTYGKSR
jgi:arginine decarboxylase-like protein